MLSYYHQYLDIFEQELKKLLKFGSPQTLYEPVHYAMSLGGKRLRPVLCLMGCKLYSDDCLQAIPAALAIEMFHNFTLIHDDIIDQAPIRRGSLTVYRKWNINTAILSGDVMFARAFDLVNQIDVPNFKSILDVFTKTAIQVCEGQQLDMDFEHMQDVTMPEYIKMITLKTAVLIAGSLKIGAMIAGCSEEQAEYIYQFGLNTGIVFQLQDDYLDVFADEKNFGKQLGNDIHTGKKTFLFIKAMELLSPGEKEEFYVLYTTPTANPTEKIQQVKKMYIDLHIHDHVEKTMKMYHQKALEYLALLIGNADIKLELEELAQSLLVRMK